MTTAPDKLADRLADKLAGLDPTRLRDWQTRSRALSEARPAALRLVHHFSCSGGSVICKALATQPNLTLLTEIDPLSPMERPLPGSGKPTGFRPHDLLYHVHAALRPLGSETVTRAFAAAVAALVDGATREGRFLCLRGHAHSHYCLDDAALARPTLSQMLSEVAPLHEIVTVRHPLASFVALQAHGWITFDPPALSTYAARYMAFLDDHADAPILRYESFAAAPEAFLQQACAHLRLPYAAGAEQFLNVVRMSGDSGRRDAAIAPRPPRPVDAALAAEARQDAGFGALCARLGYDVEDAIPTD